MSERARAYEMMYGHRRIAVGQKRQRGGASHQPRTHMTIQEIIKDEGVRKEAAERAERDKAQFPDD